LRRDNQPEEERRNVMVETKLSCQYCGEHFETKSDLQDHEANCQEKGQKLGNQQQPGAAAQSTGGKPRQSAAKQQTT